MTKQNPYQAARLILWIAVVALAAGLLGYRIVSVTRPAPAASAADVGGPFTLTAHTGARVTEADFRGRPMLVFFGFTYCPDVCPLTLQKLSIALDALDADGDAFQPIMISVDPERDTPEALAAYVDSNGFPDQLIGLTGSLDEIRAAAKAYRVHFEKSEDPDSTASYTVDHTSIIYLMDDEGRFVKPFTHAQTPAQIAEGLRTYLNERGRGAG